MSLSGLLRSRRECEPLWHYVCKLHVAKSAGRGRKEALKVLMEARPKIEVDREIVKRLFLELLDDPDVCKALKRLLERDKPVEDGRGNRSVFI